MAAVMSSPRPLTPFPHTHVLNHGQHASYFHHIPYEAQPHAYTARPIHFHVRPMVSPTPPSLLRKASGSSRGIASPSLASSPSSSQSQSTPKSIVSPSPRRASSSFSSCSSSASIASPPMPSTPVLESESIEVPSRPLTPFDLPPSLSLSMKKHFNIPNTIEEVLIPTPLATPSLELEAEATFVTKNPWDFSYDPYSTHLSTGEPIANGYLPSSSPQRPKLKRRDTPIPYAEFHGKAHPRSSRAKTLAEVRMQSVEEEDRESRVLRSVIDGGAWVIV